MAVGQVIGRVSVKVMPDTSDFRKDLKPKLEKIEQQTKLKIHATLDQTGLKSEILKTIRELNAEIRTKDAYKIKFRAGISTVGLRNEVREAQRKLSSEARLGNDVLIKVELDNKTLEKVTRELKHWHDRISPMKIAVAPDLVNGTPAAIAARLRILTRPRTVDIVPKIDSKGAATVATTLAALSGARVLNEMLDGLWNRLKRLDKAVPIIGTVAEAIAGLSAWGLTASSNLFALSASLAQIGPAALALPGIVGGLAIGVTAFAVAMKDFNKYVPAFAVSGSKATTAGVAWKKLQDTMSSNFWKTAAKPVRDLIETLFPQFSSGMNKVSTELGGFTANLATAFKGVFNGALQGMFDDLGASIKVMSGYTDHFASVFKILGEVGAGYLPKLAKWFGDITANFDAFLTKAQNDGSLTTWIDNGIFQLKELGRALGNIGGILNGLSDAALAAGGSSLTMFADTLQSVENTVKGATFQTNLTATLKAAHDAMSQIAKTSGPAFDKLMLRLSKTAQQVFPLMGQTIGTALDAIFSALSQPAVATGLVTMFVGLQKAVQALAPAMGPVGLALGTLMGVIGELAAVIGPVLATALIALSDVIVKIGPGVRGLIDTLGGGLLAVVSTLAPIVETLGSALAALITGPLASGLSGIFSQIAGPLAELGTTIQKILPQVAKVLGPLIVGVGKILAAVLPVVIDGLNQILVAISPLLPYLAKLAQILGVVLPPVLKIVAEILIGSIVGAVQGAVMVITGLIDVITGLVTFFKDIFTGQWSAAWGDLLQILTGALRAIGGAILVFLNVGVLGAFGKGFKLIKALFAGGWDNILKVSIELFSSLKGRFSTFLKELASAPLKALGALKSLFKGAWGDIKAAAQLLIDALPSVMKSALSKMASAARTGVTTLKSIAKAIPSKLYDAITGQIGLMESIGENVVKGLIQGIKAMGLKCIDAITGVVKGAINKAKHLLGIHSPSRVFKEIGQFLSKGFALGIAGGTSEVAGKMDKLIALLHKAGESGLVSMAKTTRAHLMSLAKDWQSLQNQIDATKKRLADLKQAKKDYAAAIATSIKATGDPTGLQDVDFGSIIEKLQQARDQAFAFGATLAKLKKLGLNSITFDQLAQAGPEAALAAAQAIADSGSAGVKQLNALQSQINSAADSIGKTASQVMYDNGIHIAEGLLAGLRSKQKEVNAAMVSMAKALVAAIKKELGIHSPSRVFAALGGHVGQGFIDGIQSMQDKADAAIRTLGSASPDIARHVDSGLGFAGGGDTKILNYYAASGNSLDSEEELFDALDRARSNGF